MAAGGRNGSLSQIDHIVVIYEENHSFDNLYGGWEGVNGRANASAGTLTQMSQAGLPFSCLKQVDVNLTNPPLTSLCTDQGFTSHFFNGAEFQIDTFIAASAKTCPAQNVFGPANGILDPNGLPGGCTRDLVHRYYQEQYQIDNGRMDRYVAGSDAVGLTMGYYDTTALPIYQYLHVPNHPSYAIADNFFQSAFGGSFLNHQWLIAAHTPEWPSALNDASANDLHSVVDQNAMPNTYPLYVSPLQGAAKDLALTASCHPPAGRPATPHGVECGDFAVNTIQPLNQPYSPGTALAKRLPLLTNPTIGDELSAAQLSWAWYAGGWANANGDTTSPFWTNGAGPTCSDPNHNTSAVFPNCPDGTFQFHHQAFNYYATFAPGTEARTDHLRDEGEFLQLAAASTVECQLHAVSFIKPLGVENEHPGYASEPTGSTHLVNLLQAIEGSACAGNTLVIVTYDEFGGQWDHVPPPGSHSGGVHDVWGPGTRVPALILAPGLKAAFVVDSTPYDTTSILATIERRWGLPHLGSRDARVQDLSNVFDADVPDPKH